VTGGSSGIGKCIAMECYKHGAFITLVARDEVCISSVSDCIIIIIVNVVNIIYIYIYIFMKQLVSILDSDWSIAVLYSR